MSSSRGGEIDRQKNGLNYMLSIRPNSIWLEKQIHNIYFYHIILHYIQLSSVKVKNEWTLREIFCIRSWDEVGEIVYL